MERIRIGTKYGSGRLLGAFAAIAGMLCPSAAEAHLMSTGMGPIYDGLTHFLTSPEDLLPVLGLSLLAGLRGAAYGRRAMFVVPAAWLSGCLLGSSAAATAGSPFVSSLWLLLLGGLVAADATPSLRATTVLAALIGIYHGYLNGTGLELSLASIVAVLALVFAVFALITVSAAFVVWLQAHWARIAVRVVGSWIAASGLLMLGWALHAS